MRRFKLQLLAILGIGFMLSQNAVFAGEYDRYTTLLRNSTEPSKTGTFLKHALVYPFELVRWPVDKMMVMTDKYALDTKTLWIYDKLVERGITPHYQNMSLLNSLYGMEVDFVSLLNQRDVVPNLVAKSWIDYASNIYFGTGAQVGLQRIADLPVYTYETFKYENRPGESFYGIGPHSSAGDGTAFKMEQTSLETLWGYNPQPTIKSEFVFGYDNVNITNGRNHGKAVIDDYFRNRGIVNIPGLSGDELINLGLRFDHDTRNHKDDSTSGGRQKVGFGYHEGLQSSDARYFKYNAEASQYLSLGSERRVLALHGYGEHNANLPDHNVPFHQMARLGGFGDQPALSHTLRGYDDNRFFDRSALLFNLEYRYRIWEYREMKADTVIFLDEGQVFSRLSKFQIQNFRESYGIGLRFSAAHHILFSFEVAHGDEGTNFYVRSNAPF